MAKASKSDNQEPVVETPVVTPNDQGWTDHVLSLLSDDEKIKGNPTTDGLRRIFEIALDCVVIGADSTVVQSPDPSNEKRATVVHNLSYVLKNLPQDQEDIKYRSVSGAADVYWGNCDKIFRNHPVAVAETRAEGRALRRALKLRKVVAAEEIAENIEDNVDGLNVSKISSNQINFIDVLSKRLNINTISLFGSLDLVYDSIYNINHEDAVSAIQKLNQYQQDLSSLPESLTGYQDNWK
jgi:hypothetical protein